MKRKIRVSFNSPIILGFAALCFMSLFLNWLTRGFVNETFCSVYRSSMLDPFTYIRFFGHVIGHANWDHLIGNMMLLLVVGPLLEEKYGSMNIVFVILTTALVTGIVHFVFFPHTQLLGASGVVFAFILLSSFTGTNDGTIPFTLILVSILYIGEQIYQGIFVSDSVSNLTHIIGGLVGAGIGFALRKQNPPIFRGKIDD